MVAVEEGRNERIVNFQQLREKYKAPYNRELNEKLKDPPPVLVLRRTGVRDVPTGERVALYYNQKLGLTFSVPYGSKSVTNVTAEEILKEALMMESSRHVLKQLQTIVNSNQIRDVVFNNGSTTKIDVTTAKSILELYNQLNMTNQKNLSQMISKTPENLGKVSAFAFKNLR